IPFVSGNEERGKKRQALDVIPVCVADQQIAAQRPLAVLHQLGAKGDRAGAAIEHCDRPGSRPHLDAGGVASVAESTWPWYRVRTTSTPKSHEHAAAFVDNVSLYATAASGLRSGMPSSPIGAGRLSHCLSSSTASTATGRRYAGRLSTGTTVLSRATVGVLGAESDHIRELNWRIRPCAADLAQPYPRP